MKFLYHYILILAFFSVSFPGICQNVIADSVTITCTVKNNPSCHLYHEAPYKTFDWRSQPEIDVNIVMPQIIEEYNVVVDVLNVNGKSLYSGSNKVTTDSRAERTVFKLEKPLIEPRKLKIDIKKDNKTIYSTTREVDLIRFYGRVTDFEGSPVAGAWIVTLGYPFQIAATNEKGEYNMYLPKVTYNCIAAMTDKYPAKALENYIWNIELKDDFSYDFKIGTAEIFRLMASSMPQNNVISGTFISWTCSVVNDWMNSKTTEKYEQDDSLFHDPYIPLLKKDEVRFYLDDIEIKEVPLFERADVLVYGNKVFNAGYRFEFSIPRNLPDKKLHTLKVEIDHSYTNSAGTTLHEKGRATLHNLAVY